MKDAYYFPHDCNARHDPKIVSLSMRWKNLAYSAYFITIEILREQNDYRLQAKLKPCLQVAWSTYETLTNEAFLELYNDMIKLGLLEENDSFIFSSSLIQRMQVYDNRRDALREAGRKGGLSSAQAKLKQGSSKAQAVKESKVKENKYKPKASNGTPQGVLMNQFLKNYLTHVGEPYYAVAADYVLITKLLKQFGSEAVLDKMQLLFLGCKEKTLWFAKEDGLRAITIKNLSCHWNKIYAKDNE